MNAHATLIALAEKGVLIRGESGYGKSLLALQLLKSWNQKALPNRLIADDQVLLSVENGALLGTCPETIMGLIELRGFGIVQWPSAQSHTIDFVINLTDDYERMPETQFSAHDILGVSVSGCAIPQRGRIDALHQQMIAEFALEMHIFKKPNLV